MLQRGRFCLFAESGLTYSAATIELIQRSTVIDMLGLLTLNYPKLQSWIAQPARFTAQDFARLRASGITIFHPAVGFTDGNVYDASLRDITGWNEFIACHSSDFLRIDSTAHLQQAKASGRLGIVIGQQNSLHFRTLEDVDRFYQLGQRVSQLTYDDNAIGGGSTDPRNVGLTAYGAQIVERMNRLGMAVDVSHCSDRTTLDAIEASSKPVLVTHSNCRSLVPGSRRCKTDEAIRKIASTGGVMGITGVRPFVTAKEPTTIENVLDHYDHVAKLVGVEHLGVGSDIGLDGYDALPEPVRKMLHANYKASYGFREKDDIEGLNHPKRTYDLTEGLIRRGYSDADITLILGGNFQRALTKIWSAPGEAKAA